MIDGGVFLGRNPSTGSSLDPETLIARMDAQGIRTSLAVSYKSIFFDFREGNADILEAARRYPGRIFPVAVIQPWGFDIARDATYLDELWREGVRVLGFYKEPRYYDLALESPLVRELVHAASQKGFVIQFGIQAVSDLAPIAGYGNLAAPVLIRFMAGRAYHALAEVLYLLRGFRNFYFEAGSFTPCGAIRRLVETAGAQRFYWASNIPESFSRTSELLIRKAGLAPDLTATLLGGTLERLLDLPSSKTALVTDAEVEKLMNHPKIDTHWHTDGWNLIEPMKDASHFPELMNRYHIQAMILSSIRSLNYDVEQGNASLFALTEKDPRYFALIVVDPRRPGLSLNQIETYAGHPRCAGLKTIQDLYGLTLADKAYRPLLEAARKFRLPVMAHIPGMLQAAQAYPDVTFVCAHATYARVAPMFGQKNIYFDIATSHHDAAETRLEDFVREAGENRILFASDAPLMDPAWTLGKLASVSLPAPVLKKIFQDNAFQAFSRLKACVVVPAAGGSR